MLQFASSKPVDRGGTSLDHEVLDHSVEDDAVKVSIFCMCCEVLDCLGDALAVKADRDVADRGV